MQWGNFERIFDFYVQKRKSDLELKLEVKSHRINQIKFLKYNLLVKAIRQCYFKHTCVEQFHFKFSNQILKQQIINNSIKDSWKS
jgi:hypothetical protein